MSLEPRAVSTEIAGTSIHSLQAGNGPPVVVLHHSFGNAGWSRVHDALAANHRVLVPDLPGFGASEQPQWARDVRDLAILTGLWMDAEGCAPAAIVGCGFGGWVAAELAVLSPTRLTDLVLVGAAGIRPHDGRIFDQMLVAHSAYVREAFADPDVVADLYGDPLSDETLLAWDLNREMVARVAWKPYMYNRRLEPLLSEVDVPTLVVWGSEDSVVPLECGERYRDLLPDARFEVVEGSGHAVDIERPDELVALVESYVTNLVREDA